VGYGINGGADWDGYDDSDRRFRDFKIRIGSMNVDAGYLQTLGLKMIQGRWFDANDRNNVIVNETAIRELNIAAPHIGQRFSVWGRQGQIIGIIKDFHFAGLHQKIGPMVLTNTENNSHIVFRAHPGKMNEAVHAIKQVWKRSFPDVPLEIVYTEDVFNNLYQDDTRRAQTVSMLGFLSIFISCLGLFGLVTFMAERRAKEIGIRKVLGASVGQIVKMLSGEYLLLTGIALLIAFPPAYYWLEKILQGYAYRVNIDWWMFALAGLITIGLTVLTVCWQAIGAATANPVKSIKTE
jgi:predicted lysophospholipase L1 biosynthesis ABC-type transport system permease subunit